MTQTDASNRAEDLQTSIAVHARLSAFGSRRKLVTQPNVRERATHHHFVVTAAGAV